MEISKFVMNFLQCLIAKLSDSSEFSYFYSENKFSGGNIHSIKFKLLAGLKKSFNSNFNK